MKVEYNKHTTYARKKNAPMHEVPVSVPFPLQSCNNNLIASVTISTIPSHYTPYNTKPQDSIPKSNTTSRFYKNPFVKLGARPILLFLFGTSTNMPFSSTPSAPGPNILPLFHGTDPKPPTRLLMLPPIILLALSPAADILKLLPFSILRLFQPSSSRSRRRAFSFSSRSSRSARRAESSLADSEACSSSIVLRSLSTLSRMRLTSSERWAFCLSFRSSWVWRSLTVRSTLRTERWDLLRSVSCCSSSDSSWDVC
ncbi:hypothetical protein GE09DRAFT_204149 [Coniochaeta sp. 2T2.1]|nr:hypothetical protein GE09DRAFT_204149 [Coniochaeta sp. 2T2.1]